MQGDDVVVKFQVALSPELIENLRGFSKKVFRPAAKRVVSRSVEAKMLLRARSNATFIIGGRMGALIGKHMEVFPIPSRKGVAFGVRVSPTGNAIFQVTSKAGRQNYIPFAIEYGHVIGEHGSELAGKSKGARALAATGLRFVAPIPFMRPAFDQAKTPTAEYISSQLEEEINRIAMRAFRKNKRENAAAAAGT